MVLGPLIKSALKETIEKLPEDFAMKSESIPNMLVKQGVKPEELKFAKLGIPEGKVTKQDLVQAEAGRQDAFSVREYDQRTGTKYDYVTLRGEEENPTYVERVYKWNDQTGQTPNLDEIRSLHQKASETNELQDIINAEEAARKQGYDPDQEELSTWLDRSAPIAQTGYESSHFEGTKGYLMHARTIDQDLGDGKKTRTILELQSDLHQQGRQHGYRTVDIPEEDLDKMISLINNYSYNPNSRFLELAGDIAKLYGWDPEGDQSIKAFVNQQTGAPRAPLESNWLRKLMEFETARGIEDGAEQIAIPLKGPATESLVSRRCRDWETVLS